MIRVIINGWTKGLNKVALNHLLRSHVQLGLREAKQAVDQLISGETIEFEVAEPTSAAAFCASASSLGACCSMVPQERSETFAV